ncbi:fasciclin domain-containing protein [Beijerinckia sp. L45]|uniref:fasciclin domain-containing protein n=1 Tax=Beijerinckia sp. L45 TaxID=1641855 RepID=UPI00131DEC9D|nr:fasciclin domain-containing protein [Beijerinckia sp. L45]
MHARWLHPAALLMLVVVAHLIAAGDVRAEDAPRFALLIGNSSYGADGAPANGTTALPDLHNPCNDVMQVGAALVMKSHWKDEDVKVVCDADNLTMTGLLNDFIVRFQDATNPTALLYFAGHGVQVRGRNYLFGARAAPDLKKATRLFQGDPYARLFINEAQDLNLRIASDVGMILNGGVMLIVMDACRTNPLLSEMKRPGGIAEVAGISPVKILMGVENAFSTSEGAPASDGIGDMSPYAEAFIKRLDERGSINDVLDEIATDVYRRTMTGRLQQPDKSGHFLQPPTPCFPDCNAASPIDHVATEGAQHVNAGSSPPAALAGSRGVPALAPASAVVPNASAALNADKGVEDAAPKSEIAVDILFCDGDDRSASRRATADTIASKLRESIGRQKVHASSVVSSVRVRALPASENLKPDLSYDGDVIQYDPSDKRAVQWGDVVRAGSPKPLTFKAPLVRVADYLSVYVCDGTKLSEDTRRVYVQLASQNQEFIARKVLSDVRSSFDTLAVADELELRPASPDRSEVRFYKGSDKPFAEGLAKVMQARIGRAVIAKEIDGVRVKPGLFEMWFGKDVNGLLLQANVYSCGGIDCGGNGTAVAAAREAQGHRVAVGGAPMLEANKNVSEDHTTLVSAVKAAGLVDILSGPGPFTLFAPTNEAFAKLPPGKVTDLLKPGNAAELKDVLSYHVIPGKLTTSNLKTLIKAGNGRAVITTVQGEPLTFEQSGSDILLMDSKGGVAKVTIPNIMQSNGIMHVINTVMVP